MKTVKWVLLLATFLFFLNLASAAEAESSTCIYFESVRNFAETPKN